MIQKAIDILKVRWPEVVLVVVLQSAMMLFWAESSLAIDTMTSNQNAQIPFWNDFFVGVGIFLFIMVWTMLYLGFLKTSAVDGALTHQPMDLLRTGRPYFWKIVLFQFLLILVLWLLSVVVILVLGSLIWGTQDVTKIPEWFLQICALGVVVIMMKPSLFIPARIIVHNEAVTSAFFAVRQYRLNDIDHIYRLIAGLIGFAAVFSFLIDRVIEKPVIYYVLSGIFFLILSLMSLWLTLTVVLWVQKQLETQQAYSMEGPVQE